MSDSLVRPRIVVADDEPAVRRILQRLLEEAGFAAVPVADGPAALAAVEAAPTAGALIDLRMPGWDGLETLQRLRAVRPSLPVVLLTGHGDVPTAVTAIQAGADDFLQKPCDRAALLASVIRAIERRKPAVAEATAASAPASDRRVAEALRHVDATDPGQRTSLTQVAAQLRVSPSHLNRLIERETGQTFTAHERAARMTLAASLLQTTSLSVKEVATQAGYSHASSFDRWFRRMFGMTPGQYRRRPDAAPLALPAPPNETEASDAPGLTQVEDLHA
jgi:YesN/AraC family two-component response regulator